MYEAAPFRMPDPFVSRTRTDVFSKMIEKHGGLYFETDLRAVSVVVMSSGVYLEMKKYREEVGGSTLLFDLSFFSDVGFSNEQSAEENAALYLHLSLLNLIFIDGLVKPESKESLWSEHQSRKANESLDQV